VLDWEMATLGDPLADLGFVTAMWSSPPGRFDFNPVTQHTSFPSAEELAKRYARKTGRDLSSLPWYQVFAQWRLAVLVYGATQRMRSGPVDGDPLLVAFPDGVEDLAARAWELSR
jgi:aminoglycoside phosphotransferase (APT) family kinase protein